MSLAPDDQSGGSKDNSSPIRTLRIHVIVPSDDENLNPLLVRPIPPELNFNEPRIISDKPGLSRSIGRAMCQRLHNFAHHIASRPLLFVTVVFLLMNLVILLTFCCLRCRVRGMRKAAFKRQLRRMPAYLEPASVKIDMILPQPPTEREADELPPKEPIV
ncbi:unnamed protein product [Schistocephalus solidus]|uniref:Uncharacterized protein n=1 Tax=Schistocephalus solidus TaxID=70667 RepID=A0A183SM10_SCHSO|nr:unnamed protein product [Schistocephalus solidus]